VLELPPALRRTSETLLLVSNPTVSKVHSTCWPGINVRPAAVALQLLRTVNGVVGVGTVVGTVAGTVVGTVVGTVAGTVVGTVAGTVVGTVVTAARTSGGGAVTVTDTVNDEQEVEVPWIVYVPAAVVSGIVAAKENEPPPFTTPEPNGAVGELSSVAVTVSKGVARPARVTEPPAAREVGLTDSDVAV